MNGMRAPDFLRGCQASIRAINLKTQLSRVSSGSDLGNLNLAISLPHDRLELLIVTPTFLAITYRRKQTSTK
jgi:hypothetical protein